MYSSSFFILGCKCHEHSGTYGFTLGVPGIIRSTLQTEIVILWGLGRPLQPKLTQSIVGVRDSVCGTDVRITEKPPCNSRLEHYGIEYHFSKVDFENNDILTKISVPGFRTSPRVYQCAIVPGLLQLNRSQTRPCKLTYLRMDFYRTYSGQVVDVDNRHDKD